MSTKQTGLQKNIHALMKQTPNKLFTYEDIMEEFDVEQRAAENGLYNLWRKSGEPDKWDILCYRHADPDPETGLMRHGLKIAENKRMVFKPSYNLSKPKPGKRRRGKQVPTAREIRAEFAQAMNTLAKLEDIVADVVELAEDTEKKMLKIQNLLE